MEIFGPINAWIFFVLGKFVIGRVIKAMQANWHPDCFRCEICNDGLADSGFVKNAGRYVTVILDTISCVKFKK